MFGLYSLWIALTLRWIHELATVPFLQHRDLCPSNEGSGLVHPCSWVASERLRRRVGPNHRYCGNRSMVQPGQVYLVCSLFTFQGAFLIYSFTKLRYNRWRFNPFTRSVHDYGHYSSGQYRSSVRKSLRAGYLTWRSASSLVPKTSSRMQVVTLSEPATHPSLLGHSFTLPIAMEFHSSSCPSMLTRINTFASWIP